VEEPLRERLGDWVAALGRRQLIGLACAAVVTVGGAALWYVRSLPRAVAVTPAAAPSAVARASPTPAMLVVHVAGWVRHPGVYEFPEGSRVVDAIERAGGAKQGADLAALNLAALLSDGQQVLVPKRGPPGAPAGTGVAANGLININTATAEQLEELPGIGPVLAQNIVDYRTEHGPFATVEDLLNVSGIGEARLEELRDMVTV
jgi:competence protein ComEA